MPRFEASIAGGPFVYRTLAIKRTMPSWRRSERCTRLILMRSWTSAFTTRPPSIGDCLTIEEWEALPERRSLEIFERRDGRFVRTVGASGGRLGNVPGCPDLYVDLDELWNEFARLGPND